MTINNKIEQALLAVGLQINIPTLELIDALRDEITEEKDISLNKINEIRSIVEVKYSKKE